VREKMFAILETGSKQYRVQVGDVIFVEQLAAEQGSLVNLDNILAVGDKIGSPHVKGAAVSAEVLEHRKSDKVIIFKKKRRHNYRRKKGHRQNISVLRVKEIIS
jgi:large subunit ribosomal protein L21